MRSNQKKFHILFATCLIIILGFWFYCLRLNIKNGLSNDNKKSGLTFSELKNEISEILQKSPLTNNSETQNSVLNEIKGLNNNENLDNGVEEKQNEEIDGLKKLTDKLTEEIKRAQKDVNTENKNH